MSGKKGTYVGLRVLAPANELLYKHCKDAGVPVRSSMFENRLHTTVIYSRTHCNQINLEHGQKYIARFAGYDIFSGQKGEKVLVMKLEAPGVSALHNQIMSENEDATYDFAVFRPHITLSYNYTDNNTMGIPIFPHDIILGEAYAETLDLEWGK
jgi:hypothetical protein